MKVGIVSSAVPLVLGGYRLIAEWLEEALRDRGHDVEIVYVPNTDNPDTLLQQMAAFRSMKLDNYFERVITLRPPAHMVRHPAKSVWFIHHVRIFYDLWGHNYSPMPDRPGWRALRNQVIMTDTVALREARHLATNSRVVSERLARFNGLPSEVLYPPISRPERFRSDQYGDEIVCVCRMEHHKRQHLLIEAIAHTRSEVRLRLCGSSFSSAYPDALRESVRRLSLDNRVVIDDRWISEAEKIELLAGALANAYVPFDEDSYGFPTLEAAHARRCTITVTDSGGVSEFVQDGVNGFVVPPEPEAIAVTFDALHRDRDRAGALGEAAHARIEELGITWDLVVQRLLS